MQAIVGDSTLSLQAKHCARRGCHEIRADRHRTNGSVMAQRLTPQMSRPGRDLQRGSRAGTHPALVCWRSLANWAGPGNVVLSHQIPTATRSPRVFSAQKPCWR